MHVAIVHIQVKPEHTQDFIAATQINHLASVKEPGNLRFDVLQSDEDPAHFLLYEAYKSAQDASAHKLTAHYLAWREALAPWMATARRAEQCHGLFPALDT